MVPDYEDSWFRAMLKTGLGHLGSIIFTGSGPDTRVTLTQGSGRTLAFEQSVAEIHARIVIDEETRTAMWPNWSVAAASVAYLSIHVEEALDAADVAPDTIRLTESGVEAVALRRAGLLSPGSTADLL
ncbi:hypothetical protein [Arthrobacter sp. Br18]|uniref:hypothetical protein n=1 Tax=Arthrobacter sp. Br18 TaxID=1312954 RepID=UPI00047A50F8|nr:hypothetical protein [Arthrobacter sp. Br18]